MSAPFKVLVFSVFVVVAIVLVVLFNFNLLQFRSNSEVEKDVASVVQTTEEVPPSQMVDQIDDSKDFNLENGKKLYISKTCALCHGNDGKANTTMGKAVGAVDLTLKEFKANKDNLPRLKFILDVIENGVPGTGMVSFKNQIPSEKDREDLAAYVNSLSK